MSRVTPTDKITSLRLEILVVLKSPLPRFERIADSSEFKKTQLGVMAVTKDPYLLPSFLF